jgi:hypothetical protein
VCPFSDVIELASAVFRPQAQSLNYTIAHQSARPSLHGSYWYILRSTLLDPVLLCLTLVGTELVGSRLLAEVSLSIIDQA